MNMSQGGTIDWNNPPCLECGWTAGSSSSSSLGDIVQRYGQVAEAVNRREFKRFVGELKELWSPLPAADEEWEEGYRGEGWTDEGAFALCVFQQAMNPNMPYVPHRKPPRCEAEERNQVLPISVESLLEEHHIFSGPLFDPQPREKISEALAYLRAMLQQQADDHGLSEGITVELPKDFEDLLRVSDGINGAGIPSETAETWLVGGLGRLVGDQGAPGGSINAFILSEGCTPYAAWELGGCTQHRQIYYVLCRESGKDAASLVWKIFDRADVELDVYDNLAEFISHQTEHIEKRPGGHQQEHILYASSYPVYN